MHLREMGVKMGEFHGEKIPGRHIWPLYRTSVKKYVNSSSPTEDALSLGFLLCPRNHIAASLGFTVH